MSRYALNLPQQLKQEAEAWAQKQGVSLNQFILWATAEKVGALDQQMDDPRFPQVTYRRGATGAPRPVMRGTGIHVPALVVASEQWGMTAAEIANEYGVSEKQVEEALAFVTAHRDEIEANLAVDARLSARAHD